MENLAEFIGIMLGDGSIFDGKTVKRVEIILNKNEDVYAKEVILPMFRNIFNKELKIRNFKWNAIGLYVNSKDVVNKLKNLGLIPGNKVKNQVGIPDWLFSDIKLIKACLRGLIDTDGCIFKRVENNRPRLEFYTMSKNLANDFIKAMKIIGIRCSLRVNRGLYVCGVYSWREVKKFSEEIGFKNLNNINRIKALNLRW